MRHLRTYSAFLLLLIFGCYYSSISLFSHTHIVGGTSLVHSHLGGNSEHDHTEAQYVVINILSNFQSEAATDFCHTESPFYLISEICTEYSEPLYTGQVQDVNMLRGPPQC